MYRVMLLKMWLMDKAIGLRDLDPALWSAFAAFVIASVAIGVALYLWAGRGRARASAAVLALAGLGAAHAFSWNLTSMIAAALLIAAALAIAVREGVRLRRARGRGRRVAIALSATAMLCALGLVALGIHARSHALRHPSERLIVRAQMIERPGDPWPRGTGHVPLGMPGVAATDKAYMEPGGSFSPAVGSFGLSLWVRGADGALIATSDSIALAQTRHSYSMDARGHITATARTPYYALTWSVNAPGSSSFKVVNLQKGGGSIEMAVRGVGPAGAPFRAIRQIGNSLHVGDDWRIDLAPGTRMTAIGTEHDRGWRAPSRENRGSGAVSPDGWAFARFTADGGVIKARIARKRAVRGASVALPLAPRPFVNVPDPDFAASLDAQTTTLLIGLVGNQTRPGEPINYPLAWQRDGAYVLVALARAGQSEIARKLALDFARNDYFGGFGAEADAPGLSLWALGEVNTAQADTAFTRDIWPDVVRKVAAIRMLREASADVRARYVGPVVPAYAGNRDLSLVAGPAQNGLINGRMDWQRPVFFVNAVSFAGLNAAADIAERLGHRAQANAWRAEAASVREAWLRAFGASKHGDLGNERTAIVGLWPTDIAPKNTYAALLDRRWGALRSPGGALRSKPLWTYFTVAEAHQWLRLGRADRVWPTVRQLWADQPIPGLYTLWEGKGEENSFGLWQHVRGWAQPPHVTPHYWSAAEMLLLQLEMLAYVDRDGIVIGAGIPASWLAKPFSATRVGTSGGPVSYSWDGKAITLSLPPALLHQPVRLGRAFPVGTAIRKR